MESVVNLIQTNQLDNLPISAQNIEAATKEDEILSNVSTSEQAGWLKNEKFQKLYNHIFILQLTIYSGCILKGLATSCDSNQIEKGGNGRVR